jgi:hypothetical protein
VKYLNKRRGARMIRTSIWSAKPQCKVAIESLERRVLLSTYITDPISTHHAQAVIQSVATPTIIDLGAVPLSTSSASNPPFTPSQIRQAYGADEISFDGTAGTGAGQTIAIIDAYSDPDIISDANSFSANFGLPQFNGTGEPTLTVLNQSGGTSLPSEPTPGTWDAEESLDVESVHTMAPDANIILFEANNNDISNLYAAVSEAADYAGVSVVSMSWDNTEFSDETASDSIFTTPKGHQGVTFLASTGDVGGVVNYPSSSPNVIAVGGTTLTVNSDGSYDSESAWSDSGGGVSQYESQPSYQDGKVNGTSTTNRTVPDVSIDGNPTTGVYLLDTFYNSSYQEAGGTSLSAPLWAGLIADADQGLALKGDGSLNGATQTLPDLYSLPSSDFHDITTGSNGFPATTGYDLATGLGSPIANLLVPALAGYSTSSTASQLVFTQQPTTVKAGSDINPAVTVSIEDSDGDVLNTDDSDVTLTVFSGPGVLSDATITVQAVNGVATFSNLVLDTAGNYTLETSDSSDGLSGFTSNSFTVDPAAADKLVFTTGPSSGTAGDALSTVTLSIEDQFGNIETADTSSVLISASGPGSLTGGSTTSVSAVNGVAKFTNLVLDTAGSYTLSGSDSTDGLSSGASSSFTISPASADKLVFTTGPSGGTAGDALSSVKVTIEDQFGNVETGDTSHVSISASGPGSLTGSSTTSIAAVNGVATFSSLVLDTAGSYTLNASDSSDGLSGFASSSFTISPGTADKIVFTSTPSGGTAGNALPTTNLTIEDQFGNIETDDSSSVSIAPTGPGSFTGSSTTSVNAVNGVAKFTNLVLDSAGGYTLKGTDSADGLTSAASSSFTVSPGTASQLLFTTPPTSGTAGDDLANVVLTIKDEFGNVETGDTSTVAVTATGPGSLVGTSVGVSAVNGVATFSTLVLDTAGSYTLKGTDGADGLTSAASNSFTISPAGASQLAITAEPTNGTAGDAIAPVTFTIEDKFGNVETGDTSSVAVSTSGGGSFGTGAVTSVKAANGVATFSSLIFDTAASYKLSASDSTDSISSSVTNSFTISPTTASQLVFTTPPTGGTAGSPLSSVSVSIEDQFGNVEKGDSTSVSISPTGPGSFASGSTTSVSAVNGVATFSNLVLDISGSYTLTSSDTTDDLTSAPSGSFTVAPSTTDKLVFTQEPESATAGDDLTLAVVVKIEDSDGNVITTDDSDVTLAVDTGPGSIDGTATVKAVNGVATFSSVDFQTAGQYMLKASDSTDGLSNFNSTSFTVSPAKPSTLVFTNQPTTGTAGVAFSSVQVTIEDQFGNVETGDNTTVALSPSGPGSFTAGSSTSVAAVNGVANFTNLTLDTAGSYTLSAQDTSDSVSSSQSNSITISPTTASQLAFAVPPATSTAGSPLNQIKVAIEDEFDNVETTDSSTVSVAVSGPGSFTGSSTTSVAAVNGVATFSNLTLDTAGAYTFKATDITDSVTSPTVDLTVNPASSDKLVFTQEPTGVTAGDDISPSVVVKIEDTDGNVLSTDDSNVTVTVDTGPAALSGTSVTVAAVNGVATFGNLVLDTAGQYTLSSSDSSDGLSGFVSSSFTVSPNTADKLVFTAGPANGTAGVALSQVSLTIEDQFGNVETGDSTAVLISATGPGTLAGSSITSVDAVNGVAKFSNLVLDTAGSYTLSGSDSADSLSSGASSSFTISPAAADKLVFTTPPATGTAGTTLSSVTVTIEDQFGNIETTDTSTITLSTNGPGTFTSGSVSSDALTGGSQAFDNLTLDTAGSYTIKASDAADSLTATSGSFTISPATASQLVFTTQPTGGTTGTTLPSTAVSIEDPFGNVETTDSSAVTISIESAPFDGTFAAGSTTTVDAVNGVATFSNLTLDTAGNYAYSAADTTDSLTSAESNRFTVSAPNQGAPVPSQLVFVDQPGNVTTGDTMPKVTVQIEDSSGDVINTDDSAVTISIASGPSGATLGGTLTVDAQNGVAAFSTLFLETAGNYTLSAADSTDSLTSAPSNPFTVSAPTVVSSPTSDKLAFVDQPGNITAGGTLSTVTVQIETSDGSAISTDNTQVTLSIDSGPAGATLGGTLTVTAQNGVATFTGLTLDTAGTYTLSSADSTDSLTSAPSVSFTVSPAAATHLVFLQGPTSAVAGSVISPAITIAAEDQFGNIVTTDSATVTLSITGPNQPWRAWHSRGRLTAHLVDGVATFSDLSLRRVGTYTLTASSHWLKHAVSSTFTITPAAATHLIFQRVPFFTKTGQTFVVQLVLVDKYGNVATNDTSNVTLSLGTSPSGTSLSGMLTIAITDGVATFSGLSLSTAGKYTLIATDSNFSIPAVTSEPFFIVADTFSKPHFPFFGWFF